MVKTFAGLEPRRSVAVLVAAACRRFGDYTKRGAGACMVMAGLLAAVDAELCVARKAGATRVALAQTGKFADCHALGAVAQRSGAGLALQSWRSGLPLAGEACFRRTFRSIIAKFDVAAHSRRRCFRLAAGVAVA